MSEGLIAPAGTLAVAKIERWPAFTPAALKHALPSRDVAREINVWRRRNLSNVWRGYWRHSAARRLGVPHFTGVLYLDVIRGDGTRLPYGLASMRVVTTTGVNFIVDAFQNSVELELMKYHGFGTGTGNEAVGDSALGTELTTQYNPDSTRPTGSQTENGANVYRTVATLTPDSGGTIAVTEHGIFTATSAGTLLDRSKFAAVNLDSTAGDSLQATYDFTVTSGG